MKDLLSILEKERILVNDLDHYNERIGVLAIRFKRLLEEADKTVEDEARLQIYEEDYKHYFCKKDETERELKRVRDEIRVYFKNLNQS